MQCYMILQFGLILDAALNELSAGLLSRLDCVTESWGEGSTEVPSGRTSGSTLLSLDLPLATFLANSASQSASCLADLAFSSATAARNAR